MSETEMTTEEFERRRLCDLDEEDVASVELGMVNHHGDDFVSLQRAVLDVEQAGLFGGGCLLVATLRDGSRIGLDGELTVRDGWELVEREIEMMRRKLMVDPMAKLGNLGDEGKELLSRQMKRLYGRDFVSLKLVASSVETFTYMATLRNGRRCHFNERDSVKDFCAAMEVHVESLRRQERQAAAILKQQGEEALNVV